MRYDTPIYFQVISPGPFDEESGNYGDDAIEETKRYASIQPTKISIMQALYGEIKQGSLTIGLQTAYNEPFHRIRIGEKVYAVDAQTKFRTKHSITVSEVH